MSPPIRDGSGSSIGSIRLGDGSEISEVRTGAGDVLFSAIPASLVARWTFNSGDISGTTAEDIVAGNHNATIDGATTGAPGLATTYSTGEAISYDGSNDRVFEDGIAWDASSEDITWSCWVNLDNTNSGQILSHEDGTNSRFAFFWDGNAVSAMVFDGSSTIGEATSVSTGTSVHLIGAYDASAHDITFYVNGSSVTGTIAGPRFKGGVTGIAMGSRIGGSEKLAGDQDDVRNYSKLLSSSEASNLFNNGSI